MTIEDNSTTVPESLNDSPEKIGEPGFRILSLPAYLANSFPNEPQDYQARIDDKRGIWIWSADRPDSKIGTLPDHLAFCEIEVCEAVGGFFVGTPEAIEELQAIESCRQAAIQDVETLTDQIHEFVTSGLTPPAEG